jgi:hypothetical protein
MRQDKTDSFVWSVTDICTFLLAGGSGHKQNDDDDSERGKGPLISWFRCDVGGRNALFVELGRQNVLHCGIEDCNMIDVIPRCRNLMFIV